MNKKIFILSLVLFLGLFLAIYQYAKELQTDLVSAYSTSKPANGHSWSEMECTSDVCITGSKVGMGTDNPTVKLEVVGDFKASGDVCNGTGNCLSALASLTNACGGAARNYVSTATAYSGNYCVMGTSTPASPDFPSAGGSATWTCPVTNGSPISCTATRDAPIVYLIGGLHTTAQCSGTVVNNMCKITGTQCPTGWTQYQNWSTTSSVSLLASNGGGSCSASTGSHTWSDTAVEHACATLYYIDPSFMQGGSCTTISSSTSDNYYSCSPAVCGTVTSAQQCSDATVLEIGCY